MRSGPELQAAGGTRANRSTKPRLRGEVSGCLWGRRPAVEMNRASFEPGGEAPPGCSRRQLIDTLRSEAKHSRLTPAIGVLLDVSRGKVRNFGVGRHIALGVGRYIAVVDAPWHAARRPLPWVTCAAVVYNVGGGPHPSPRKRPSACEHNARSS